jgi:lipoprotein-anchoring transpeptidase ErfK/SrfK
MPTPEHTEPPSSDAPRSTTLRANLFSALAGVLVVALGVAGVMWLSNASGDGRPQRAAPAESVSRAAPEPPVKRQNFAKLVESTTHTTLDGTQPDPDPQARTRGVIVRPKKMLPIYDHPGGKPVGKIGSKQIGETWLPVIDKRDGWTQVMLPSKPNGSTGWLQSSRLTEKFTPYVIAVHLKSMRMQLFFKDRPVDDWEIGIGKPDTPTPTGRTFLLGSIVDANQNYSPVILPLGSHSATLDSFGGGPGTVAIHTWPTTDVLGTATSHGCIRVPKQALTRLQQVPLGTLVLVDQQ